MRYFLFVTRICLGNHKSKTYFLLEASISPEISVTEVRKLWFAEPETSPSGSRTVRVTLQELKTVTQLLFFKLW